MPVVVYPLSGRASIGSTGQVWAADGIDASGPSPSPNRSESRCSEPARQTRSSTGAAGGRSEEERRWKPEVRDGACPKAAIQRQQQKALDDTSDRHPGWKWKQRGSSTRASANGSTSSHIQPWRRCMMSNTFWKGDAPVGLILLRQRGPMDDNRGVNGGVKAAVEQVPHEVFGVVQDRPIDARYRQEEQHLQGGLLLCVPARRCCAGQSIPTQSQPFFVDGFVAVSASVSVCVRAGKSEVPIFSPVAQELGTWNMKPSVCSVAILTYLILTEYKYLGLGCIKRDCGKAWTQLQGPLLSISPPLRAGARAGALETLERRDGTGRSSAEELPATPCKARDNGGARWALPWRPTSSG
ncbi:hypothetical protein CCMA1212_005865 [Trichoderma ghanense]|uniref:Uncharacterized protein n=1 Tax=Trichoderma ghanense TaxID=65468 RepID=A0ABY2H1L4_9HYPO